MGLAVMQFQDAVRSGFRNYVNLSGRAARSEYWYWALFAFLVTAACGIFDAAVFPFSDPGPLSAVASLLLFLPALGLAVRRMHDMDHTGWWLLIVLTGIGSVVVLVWFCFKGTEGPNRFGPDPLASGLAISPP
jgi:uncharacterized membrane protein YhaH (DUF805 family)